MIQHQFVTIILIYILIGLAWSDFMHSAMIKSDREKYWTRTKKRLIMIFWPITFVSFLFGVLYAVINGIRK